jgi:hypothetical protein
MQVDPKEAHTLALKREVQLLRDENAYLRRQLSGQVSNGATGDIAAPRTSQAGSAVAVPAPAQAQTPDAMSVKPAPTDVGLMRLFALNPNLGPAPFQEVLTITVMCRTPVKESAVRALGRPSWMLLSC